MPHQHICKQAKAKISKTHHNRSPPLRYSLICIYKRYTSHVTAAHVSFASQLQKCPHACLAQIAPESIPNVRNAVPIYTSVSAAVNISPCRPDCTLSFAADVWLIDFSNLQIRTTAIRKAHPSNEYENIYTITCGINHGL